MNQQAVYSSKRTVKKSPNGSNGLLYSLCLLAIFFGCTFFLFLYNSHIQMGNIHDFYRGSTAKQFVFNNVERFLDVGRVSDYSTYKPSSNVAKQVLIEDVSPEFYKELKTQIHKIGQLFAKELISTDDSEESEVVAKSASNRLKDESKLVRREIHKLTCPHADLVTFWKEPISADLKFRNPFFNPSETKYVTFEPDVGGWNNIRMQMELVLVFAASTGRTLVLPPDQPMYLLQEGQGHQKAHNFADFFPFDLIGQILPVITMKEFMEREAVTGHLKNNHDGRVRLPPNNTTDFDGMERESRWAMWEYLRNVSACPTWKSMEEFVIIPPGPGVNTSLLPNANEYRDRLELFRAKRVGHVYDSYWQNQRFIHFISKPGSGFRLLEHFYTFLHFEDPAMDRYYKRFIRDYVHYVDTIFCKAALIVNALLEEGNGHYSAFHVRRGEFQYKEVKISSAEMMKNVGHLLPNKELLYIATDERNKSFFNAFKTRFPRLKFLNDYKDLAGLSGVNPNYLGMIDQVVCMRGRFFVGTWFSTFSGYITRMRGYYGFHDYSVWYADKTRRDRFHQFELPKFPFYMREWNISWANIDY